MIVRALPFRWPELLQFDGELSPAAAGLSPPHLLEFFVEPHFRVVLRPIGRPEVEITGMAVRFQPRLERREARVLYQSAGPFMA